MINLDKMSICLDLRHDLAPISSFLRSICDRLASRYPGRIVTGVQVAYFIPGKFLEVGFFDNPDFEPMDKYDGFVPIEKYYLPHWDMLVDVSGHMATETTNLERGSHLDRDSRERPLA